MGFGLILFLVYYTFMIMFSMSTIIFPENSLLWILTIIPLIALILFEVLEIISFLAYKPSIYFKDFINYFDLIILIGSTIYLFIFRNNLLNATFKSIFGIFIHLCVYYRGFFYLKIFDSFTTIVGIINTINIKIYAFMAIIVYFYLVFTTLLIEITSKDYIIKNLRDIYIWAVFGGFDSDSFEVYLSFIVVVISTVLMSVILLNVLIAYLSNLFSSLEETQALDELREKASLILNLEIILRFFRYFLTRKTKIIREVEAHNYNLIINEDLEKEEKTMVSSNFTYF